ncbi:DUF5672 family protein [Butyrivibrio sp. MB2005]|uniref:DUF5672 family protein n=1 Tax=Butyrivibrio sp. MB2005 TaxID=1280678 RepID=UPI0004001969|nr:DUF5672 family protein [Butyrivibrio sp. MB2005]
MEKQVIIIVPVYKQPDAFEIIAIKQLFRILGNYSICFVIPENMEFNLDNSISGMHKYMIESFDAGYFESKESYSRLCLTGELYGRFSDYEYLLIYQSDVFVFDDRLGEFVGYGYDYIGAPQDKSPYNWYADWDAYHVGNGGLSLRRIAKFIEIIEQKEKILSRVSVEKRDQFLRCEDLFWGYCGYCEDIDFKVPSVEEAAEFALHDDSCDVYRFIHDNGLPFGIHKWYIGDYNFWKDVIAEYGYEVPTCESFAPVDSVYRYEKDRLDDWFDNLDGSDTELLINCVLGSYNQIVVWGLGKIGRKVLDILISLGARVDRVVDSFYEGEPDYNGIPISKSDENIYSAETLIIVAVKRDFESVLEQIREEADTRSFNVLSYIEVQNRVKDYYFSNVRRSVEELKEDARNSAGSINSNIEI